MPGNVDHCVWSTKHPGSTWTICSPPFWAQRLSQHLRGRNVTNILAAPQAQAYRTPTNILIDLRDSLLRDTNILFTSELAEWQKLDAYRRFLFPRLGFTLKVIFPGVVWCRKLDTSLRAIIKGGLRLPQRTCTKYLYLSQALGGLGVPCAEDESHVVRASQAFKFLGDMRDPRIRDVALHLLRGSPAMGLNLALCMFVCIVVLQHTNEI